MYNVYINSAAPIKLLFCEYLNTQEHCLFVYSMHSLCRRPGLHFHILDYMYVHIFIQHVKLKYSYFRMRKLYRI